MQTVKMLFCTRLAYASVLLLLTPLRSLASPLLETRADGISQAVFDDLVRYTKYSSAVYQWICPTPLGNTLVEKFINSGTQGFVVRDAARKEIVVAFRGSLEVIDALIDIHIIMTPLKSTGITAVGDSYVHSGFLFAYNVVATDVLRIVKSQVAANPGYTVVVTGHSLGGSVASIAALSIRAALPSVPIKLYTYGQPRTGNAAFASLVESRIGGTNIFRAVHTSDGVPTILFKIFGYRHFATEYWNFRDSATPANVRKCSGGDDPDCSDSIFSGGVNIQHVSYFGQAMALNPLLCVGP
ncbi:putative feruloyl esterase A [Hypsizygus marmoreus]|uniref:Feruloyl esterase A n=1 Tax=Hypsizygus marmoreus TaxID=39966 RepID=A0A369JBG8_HYPMA|nr:putative feruloyl esterase A [Hypsizygus marmoreus]